MSIFEASRTLWTSRMLSVFRIVAGLVFFSYGTMKVFGFPPSPAPMPAFDPASLVGVAGILETAGGVLLVLGLLTRPVAFVLAGEMAVAYFSQHFPKAFFPTTNMGVPAVLFCFFFLYLTFSGAGVWSLDALLATRKLRERLPVRPRAPRPAVVPAGSRPMLYRG